MTLRFHPHPGRWEAALLQTAARLEDDNRRPPAQRLLSDLAVGLLYLALVTGLYLADWLATLHGDETEWATPAALAAAGLTATAVYAAKHAGHAPRPATIPSQRQSTEPLP